MNAPTTLPSLRQVHAARDQVLAHARSHGQRPSVLAAARQLGLSNTTFRRHFPDIAAEISNARRAPTEQTTDSSQPNPHDRLVARNAKLRRDNRQLREHLALAVANIQRLSIETHQLRRHVEAASGVTTLNSRGRR
jgi:predicted ArsR family transcriptional regulator